MNKLAIYDPEAAELALDSQTDEMINIINRHHKDSRQAAAVLSAVAVMQKAQTVQNTQHIRKEARLHAELRKEQEKARTQARLTGASVDVALLTAAWLARTNIHYALPLALVATALFGWLLGSWQKSFKRKKVHNHE